MNDEKFNTLLQEYLAKSSIYASIDFKPSGTSDLYDGLISLGLSFIWNRIVWHSISQRGETWTYNALNDNTKLVELFAWGETEEGIDFWKHIYNEFCTWN